MRSVLKLPDHVPPYNAPRVHIQPPIVYMEPVWEYKHLAHTLAEQEPLSETELNALGRDGWELTGVFTDGRAVHFYLKRETK